MDILKVTTDAARSKPDESPINVPSDVTDLNNNFICCLNFNLHDYI